MNQVVKAADYDRVVKERDHARACNTRLLHTREEAERNENLWWRRYHTMAEREGRLREALREIARNWPDTDMTRERVDDLLIQSASTAERALAEPEERKKHD